MLCRLLGLGCSRVNPAIVKSIKELPVFTTPFKDVQLVHVIDSFSQLGKPQAEVLLKKSRLLTNLCKRIKQAGMKNNTGIKLDTPAYVQQLLSMKSEIAAGYPDKFFEKPVKELERLMHKRMVNILTHFKRKASLFDAHIEFRKKYRQLFKLFVEHAPNNVTYFSSDMTNYQKVSSVANFLTIGPKYDWTRFQSHLNDTAFKWYKSSPGEMNNLKVAGSYTLLSGLTYIGRRIRWLFG